MLTVTLTTLMNCDAPAVTGAIIRYLEVQNYGSPEGHSDTGLQFQPCIGSGIGPGLVRYLNWSRMVSASHRYYYR